jgi:transglutaminase-like putative cysteine protease
VSQIERMIRIARRVGCELDLSARPEPIAVGGDIFHSATVRCRDNVHAVELLNAFAEDDARNDTELVDFVRGMVVASRRREEIGAELAEGIHRFVLDHVDFSEEDGERFRLPSLTLRLGTGDCDDSAHLIASMAMAAGLPARVVLLRNAKGDPTHVVAQIAHDGAWHWCEATFEARYNEHPHDAAKRLGLMRKDVVG